MQKAPSGTLTTELTLKAWEGRLVAHDFDEARDFPIPALEREEAAAEEEHELGEELGLHAAQHRHHLVRQLEGRRFDGEGAAGGDAQNEPEVDVD